MHTKSFSTCQSILVCYKYLNTEEIALKYKKYLISKPSTLIHKLDDLFKIIH